MPTKISNLHILFFGFSYSMIIIPMAPRSYSRLLERLKENQMRLRNMKSLLKSSNRRHLNAVFRDVQIVLPIFIIIIQLYIIVCLIYERKKYFETQQQFVITSNKSEKLWNENHNERNILINNRTIIVITPTYLRIARIADMTRLSQTLMHIDQLIWVVVEDAEKISLLVKQLLDRSHLKYYYFAIRRRSGMPARGWTGRDAGLEFVREQFALMGKNAVVYFADDDNTYDVRLFNDYIRNVDKIGVWAVGLVAQNVVESPKVFNRKVIGWQTMYAPTRKWGLDMAAFAVNLELLLKYPRAGWKEKCNDISPEPCLLDRLNISWDDLTPFGVELWPRNVLVWHTKTIANVKSKNTYGYLAEVPF